MAEAHSAVAFSFQVTHDGVSVSYDQELLRTIWHTVVRGYKRRIARFKNDFRTGIFPASPKSLMFVVCFTVGFYLLGFDPSFCGALPWLEKHIFNPIFGNGFFGQVLSATLFSVVSWLLLIQAIRLFIKVMFFYKGWMYESRGSRISMITKLWLATVQAIGRSGPMLHSFQGALPRLPLPSMDETLKRHLVSVRPLFNDEQYEEMVKLSEEFRNGIGRKLQWYLHLKSWFSTNYDSLRLKLTDRQAARAANITYSAMLFRRTLDKQDMKPVMLFGVPLCSAQYERLFNTCRIPGEPGDSLIHWQDSRHIAVFHNGRWFKVPTHSGPRLLKPPELEMIFEDLMACEDQPCPGEEHLGAMTAGKRIPWAQARKKFFSTGVNRTSLHAIHQAAFVLILDEEEHDYDPNDSEKLDKLAHCMIHGKGYNRWFDKTVTVVVTKNARVGINGEHSWADAPVAAHFLEQLMWTDLGVLRYDENGHTVGDRPSKDGLPLAKKLDWEMPEECQAVIENSLSTAMSLINDLEMRLLIFEEFGKGFIKIQKMSPDAFLQMALQLTYYRDQGKFCFTYEACMTRLFREGRTETARVVTQESCAFVRAMCDPGATNEERRHLLRDAADVHQKAYKDCMCGKGFDRHIFAWYVVSKYLEIESPFLDSVIHEPWRLSTSQTPHQQTDLMDLRKHPEYISAGGGFGPVTHTGYGVSYVVSGEDMISFHISSMVSASNTNSRRFKDGLIVSLREMRDIFTAGDDVNVANGPVN